VVTGGAAQEFLSGLKFKHIHDPWLVFRGMLASENQGLELTGSGNIENQWFAIGRTWSKIRIPRCKTVPV